MPGKYVNFVDNRPLVQFFDDHLPLPQLILQSIISLVGEDCRWGLHSRYTFIAFMDLLFGCFLIVKLSEEFLDHLCLFLLVHNPNSNINRLWITSTVFVWQTGSSSSAKKLGTDSQHPYSHSQFSPSCSVAMSLVSNCANRSQC